MSDDPLRAEARVLAAYLLGAEPEADLVERYVAAAHSLFEETSPRDRALVAFAMRWPAALPFLDGAAGWLRPDALLRKKVLVMAALLETTPRHAEAFLPARTSAAGLGLLLLWAGLTAAFHVLVGACLLPIAERSRA